MVWIVPFPPILELYNCHVQEIFTRLYAVTNSETVTFYHLTLDKIIENYVGALGECLKLISNVLKFFLFTFDSYIICFFTFMLNFNLIRLSKASPHNPLVFVSLRKEITIVICFLCSVSFVR